MMDELDVIEKMKPVLKKIFDDNKVEEEHSLKHALKVLKHAENALAVSEFSLSLEEKEAIKYAALLHDVDDRKFFPDSKNYQNARDIMNQIIPKEKNIHKLVIEMIKLVSCSSNGNSTNGIPKQKMWMLIPRLCDRLEATGKIGIYRAWTYTNHVNRPLSSENTPRATTEEELIKIATPERFTEYLAVKESTSMIDHFYDKILHIGNPKIVPINNSYILHKIQKRHQYVIDFILEFGRSGVVDLKIINK